MAAINFAGIASGIDSTALIEATSKAERNVRVTPKKNKVSELESTNAAFTELKAQLQSLTDLGLKFATQSGGAISKQATSSNEIAVTATASPGASNGSYTLTVNNRAKNATQSFDTRYSSLDAPVDSAVNDGDAAALRTVSYTIGSGVDAITVDVVLTSSTSVAQFVSSFNTAASGRATASYVNTGATPDPYAIVINSNYEGTAKGSITLNPLPAGIPTLLADGITDDAALDASFSISGIGTPIIRSSNSVSDVIQGVTFNIQDAGTSTVTVSDDVTATQNKVQDFIDAYNEIVLFLAENNKIERQENGERVDNVFAPLAKSRTDDNFLTSIRSAISLSAFSSGTSVRIMADLGLQTERDGTLKFVTEGAASASFAKAMSDDPNAVNEILMAFGDITSTTAGLPSVQSGGGIIFQYTKFNGLIDSSVNGNTAQITNLNDRIAQAEAGILRQEENLRARFARLESLTGRLQSQQSALTSALSGL